jgi:CubicO group peptidase (beta-lactamase class C family)
VEQFLIAREGKRWYKKIVQQNIRFYLARWVLLGVAAAAVTGCSVTGAGPSGARSLAGFTEHLGERVPQLMERYRIPGVSVAVLTDGSVAWSRAYGSADRATGRAMTTRAVCRAESISKSVTAWGVMRLVEEGRLELDAPVQRYLSSADIMGAGYSAEEVTVRGLLSNTSGLPLGTVGPEVEYAPGSEMPSKADYLAGELRLVQEPGAGFLYSNTGFNLLELLVEEVAGRSFDAYMEERVLEPLGMEGASYAWKEHMAELMPTGYELDGTPVPPYVYPVSGSGGLFADVEDLAAFVRATLSGGNGSVLNAESLDELHRPVVEVSGLLGFAADSYGLGHFIETLPAGRRALWHGGQGHGWMTHFHAVPEPGDGIVILTNSQRSWPFMSHVLSDWARWSGLGALKFGRILWAGRALIALLAVIGGLAAAQSYRLIRGLLRRERRLTPLDPAGRLGRGIEALAGVGIIGALGWALAQPYLFVSWIFPTLAEPAGWILLLAALVLLGSALLPRVTGVEGESGVARSREPA